jgi:hypothetical protein
MQNNTHITSFDDVKYKKCDNRFRPESRLVELGKQAEPQHTQRATYLSDLA